MLSNRGKYATRALLDLTLHYNEGPVLIQDIADRQNIPLRFLEQILLSLKRHGFVESRKGRGGGYLLAKPPEAITLGVTSATLELKGRGVKRTRLTWAPLSRSMTLSVSLPLLAT